MTKFQPAAGKETLLVMATWEVMLYMWLVQQSSDLSGHRGRSQYKETALQG